MTKQLQAIFNERLHENEPLAKHLNYRIGGPARWFVEVESASELKRALSLAKENQIKHVVLGGGSNVLASDDGFDGLVIKIAMREFKIDGNLVAADAGVISGLLSRATVEAGLEGFEWAATLPGTIGGAVRGNAGCFGGEMKDTVQKVEVLRDDRVVELEKDDLKFDYRDSVIKQNNDVVLRVWMELKPGNKDQLKQVFENNIVARKEKQPFSQGSAGCMFKNYDITSEKELEQLQQDADIPEDMLKNRRIAAGWLVEQLDLKGKKIGDAQISEDHGNFIVNLGKATASDVVQLVSLVKTKARERYGVQLEEEIQYIGF